MSLRTTTNRPKRSIYAGLGLAIGAGIALLLSTLGLEVEMSVGMILGLCIGTYIDERRN